jgi:hypothetical protein
MSATWIGVALVLALSGPVAAGGAAVLVALVRRSDRQGLHAHADTTVHSHLLGWRPHEHGGFGDLVRRLTAAVLLFPLAPRQRSHPLRDPAPGPGDGTSLG